MTDPSRTIFFGTSNQLSRSAFEALLATGVIPKAIAVASDSAAGARCAPLEQLVPAETSSELPMLNRFYEPTLIHSAWTAGIPVFALGNLNHPDIEHWLADIDVDVACVACYPSRIPAHLMAIPALGFLNVHPSLLPHFRGPAPLFWLFQKDNQVHRGVTIHQMDDGLDTGPLVMQEPITFAHGLPQRDIEHQCGQLGGRLLREAITLLTRDRSTTPQIGMGSYHPWPNPADYRLQASWSAQRVFDFMRATNGMPHAYTFTIADSRFALAEALDIDPQAIISAPAIHDGRIVQLQFNPGVLTARLASI